MRSTPPLRPLATTIVMAPVIFVKTDPIFMVVEGMVRELRTANLLNVIGYKTVSSKPGTYIHGNSDADNYTFRNWYNFARTSQSVLRLFMLEATGTRQFFDPKFGNPNGKLRTEGDIVINMAFQPFRMAPDESGTRRHVSEFDRLYPHYDVEYKLRDIALHQTISLPSLMYVVDFSDRKLYHIITTMDVTYDDFLDGRMVIKAKPFVAAYKYQMGDVPAADDENFKMYNLVQDCVEQYNALQPGAIHQLIQGMQHLNVDDENEDNIEQNVAEYFNNIYGA